MESDMHNLQPAVGEVNGDRGNFMYSQWNGGEGQYGQCAMKVDFKEKVAEPPARARGASPAPTSICATVTTSTSPASRPSCLTPGISSIRSPSECQRDERIAKVQGNHNPYVQRACQAQKS
jgi:deoxyribonuclease-1